MANQLVRHVAMVSESQRVSLADVTTVAAALQKQATRDLNDIWEIDATVDGFARLEDVPIDYWPMLIMDDIGTPGAAGVHLDKNGQPYALISAGDSIDDWSLTASHECLEMLVDPFGNRMVAGDSPKKDQGRVNFLVEVGDPCEAAQFAYSVNGIVVSDFYTANFFDPLKAAGVRYSFTGALTEPRQVLIGGYLSWQDLATGIWWQEIWFGTPEATFRSLGLMDASKSSIRSQIDRLTYEDSAKAMANARPKAKRAGLASALYARPNATKADSLRAEIAALRGVAGGRRLVP